MADFFISYNKADLAWAEWIGVELEKHGSTVTLQAWDFHAGSNFVLEMHKAAESAQQTIGVLSPEYLASAFTAPEWAAAFVQDPKGEKRKFVPVRVRNCKPAGLLTDIVYIDLVGYDNPDAARNQLLIKLFPGGHPTSAPFPGAPKKPTKFPGAPPAIWNVPAKNPHFTGREEDLAQIRQKLLSSKSTAVTAAGAGGIGKTTLANENAHRYATDYDIVWWMRAEEKASLAEDFATLAAKLGIEAKDAVSAVRDWLRQNSGWFVIFDNATGPDDYAEYLPEGSGHLLVTSRNMNWPSSVDLPVLPRLDAIEFLRGRSGKSDADAADKLCDALGDLPLALELAAAYIREASISIRNYLDDFGIYVGDVAASIAKRIEPSIKRLETESPKSIELLSLAAFYAPDEIPKSLLRAFITDVMAFNAAIAGLRRYALVTTNEDNISIHRLIQRATRDRMTSQVKMAEAALRLLKKECTYRVTEVETWVRFACLLPHALEAAGHTEALGVALGDTCSVLNDAGLCLKRQFVRLDSAAETMRRALSIAERLFRPDHPDLAAVAGNLGAIMHDLGNLKEAQALVERALKIDEKNYGTDHPRVGVFATNLAIILKQRGDLEAARPLAERALSILEKNGSDGPDVAVAAMNLGAILHDKGDTEGGFLLYRKALAIDEKALGNDHPEVAADCHNLGVRLAAQGDASNARTYLERALKIRKDVLGDDHPSTRLTAQELRYLDELE